MTTALRYPSFRRLMAGLAASQAGDWLYNVALLAYVYERTHSGAWLGATTAARVLPLVVLGPLGGVLADRYDRRRLMILADVLRAAVMVALAAAALFGLPILVTPVLAAIATAAGASYPACTAASLPKLVPAEELAAANAVRSVIGPICIVAGPVLGAAVLAVADAQLAFALNALTFAASALAVASIPAGPAFRAAGSAAAPQLWRELVDGATALVSHRSVMRLVGGDVLASFVYGVLTVALLFVGARVGLGMGGYGVLLGATGAGGIVGAAVAPRLVKRFRSTSIAVVALLSIAVPLPLLATSSWIVPALVFAAVGGAGAMVAEVLAETVLQRDLDDDVLARAYGFAYPVSIAGICIGGAIAAPLITTVGLTVTLVLVGVIVASYAGWLFAGSRAARIAPVLVAS